MTKLLPLFIILALTISASGQVRKKKNHSFNKKEVENVFLHKQWWIGLRGGINVSNPVVEKAYSIITPTNYEPDQTKKQYEQFAPVSSQIGMEVNFYFRGFSLSAQPVFENIRFVYTTDFSWTDPESASSRLELSFRQEHQVQYVTLPLLLRYEMAFNKISPYVMTGVYGSFLLNANKKVSTEGTDYASGGPENFETEPVIVGATDLFAPNSFGLIGGAGVYYTVGNVRLNLDVQYKYGLSLINSSENRYNNDRLSGIGDAMDNISIRNVSLSAGILFPLRFLSSGFKSIDKI